MFTKLRKRTFTAVVLATMLAAVVSIVSAADTIDPVPDGSRYAWGENVGWINAKAPGSGGNGVAVTGTKLTGYMWGENIGWINMNCLNNATCGSTGNYGVTNNGAGVLKGYAWGENVGWISFSCQNVPATCAGTGNYGVTIDPLTGLFSGKAYGENIGWIVFDYTTSAANRVKTDDGDGFTGAADNCAFDANPTQTNTDFPNTGVNLPGADALGDACDGDIDGDGYTNAQETALIPAENPNVYCDAMRADVDGDNAVTILDLAIAAGQFLNNVPPAPERLKQDADNAITILDLTKMANLFLQNVSACP